MTKSDFNILKKAYGNHTAVADALGITSRQYRRIRAGGRTREPIKKLIRLLVKSLTPG